MNAEELEIITLSKRIVEIELRKDADALSNLICDDYVGVDPSGVLIDKEISVGRYRRSDFELFQHSISDISVSILGEAAFEIGIMSLKGRIGSFDFGGRYRYTHTWLKTGSGWKVRTSQLTPILREA
ncbi:MAG: nuclear transport factor 2 family protein [Gammaproteobacteria bacterium]|nr:nuclear transport factor 2 family protein [Gammaproteobacteria bacterium]MBU0786785.1 nuclear transport factor 2 family protein [Gammaproteobacteria bacterium]MBU0814009.1 nuclear transport factor 2 family protein [Gammaproteobacteria bacterium]MBU1788518.1 nuclear transport factor 2 family protein [Gammaproteobacteria bacterium]